MKKTPLTLIGVLSVAVAIAIATQLGVGTVAPTSPAIEAPTTSAPLSASARDSLEAAAFAITDDAGQLVVSASAVEASLAELETATQLATGYDRDLFGQRWADIDRNGCD